MLLLTATPADNNTPGRKPEVPSNPTAGADLTLAQKPKQETLFDLLGTTPPDDSAALAERDSALDQIESAIDPQWKMTACAALLNSIDHLGAACVDDCRDQCCPPGKPDWWCVIPRHLARQGLIVRVGDRRGISPVTHSGLLRLWARAKP